ncbi:hypothetical protein ACQEVF_01540 [Nonomuraea polychroma]|uniref:hypothetical protein n=1 Tax=Nonomuraea polychroma TaxID=46176 RepID=UPI003D8E8209
MIDICDFAVGLSRQLYGRTISSERRTEAARPLPVGPLTEEQLAQVLGGLTGTP